MTPCSQELAPENKSRPTHNERHGPRRCSSELRHVVQVRRVSLVLCLKKGCTSSCALVRCAMRTGRPKKLLVLTEDERCTLEQWARRPTSAERLALRARVVLACTEGLNALDRLQQPLRIGHQRIAPLRFGDPRVLALLQVLTGFTHLPMGFRHRALQPRVAALLDRSHAPAQMTYDFRRSVSAGSSVDRRAA